MYEHQFYPWRKAPLRKSLLKTVDHIKHNDERGQAEPALWESVAAFSAVVIFNSYNKEANELLEAFFNVCRSLPERRPPPNDDLFTVPAETEWLELFWATQSIAKPNLRAQRPSNVPWPAWDSSKLASYKAKPDFDPSQPGFYKTWTDTDWMAASIFRERGEKINIDNSFDAHQWKGSSDPWIVAICAGLLCKPTDDQVPTREAISEAADALNRLFFDMPRRANPQMPAYSNLPHRQMISPKIHFLLAMYLGRSDDAKKIVKAAARLDSDIQIDYLQDFALQDFIDVPQFHEFLQKEDEGLTNRWLDEEEARNTAHIMIEALNSRATLGKQSPFLNVSWEELLRRFSEGLFATKLKKYKNVREDDKKLKIKSPSDILLPPLTADQIAEAEARLGPIPQDIKDMSLIAKGFRGGWHFAGGGFAGIDQMTNRPVMEYEAYLYEINKLKVVVKIEQRENRMPDGTVRITPLHHMGYPKELSFGDLLQGPGAVECDEFEHIIVPPQAWKKIKGDDYVEDTYRYFYMAYWTGGGDQTYDSFRQFIEVMTREAELALSMAKYGQIDDSEDEGEDEDEEDSGKENKEEGVNE